MYLYLYFEKSLKGHREENIRKGNDDKKYVKTKKAHTLASHLLMPLEQLSSCFIVTIIARNIFNLNCKKQA